MGEIPFVILSFVYLAAAIVLPVYFIMKAISAKQAKKRAARRRRRPAAAKAPTPPAKPTTSPARKQETPQPRKPEKQEIIWFDEMHGKACAYRYEHVGVYIPDISVIDDIEVGRIAVLLQEPSNKYDPRAVAVYTDSVKTGKNIKVGYLYRGKIQNIANDWEDRGEPAFCQIACINKQSANPDKDGVKINMSFYK